MRQNIIYSLYFSVKMVFFQSFQVLSRLTCKIALLRQQFLYKFLLILILIVLITTISLWTSARDTASLQKCFKFNSETELALSDGRIIFLEDVMKSERKPTLGKTIFFHETSCSDSGLVWLNARQACAIESAAKANPDWDVFVLFASPVGFLNESSAHPQPAVKALLNYSNVYLRNVNLWTYAKDTQVEEWINTGELFLSTYLNSHASDFLRYLSLYKWGGTYLDLDVVVQQNLRSIGKNYAGAESSTFVAAGVLNFDHTGFGHEIALLCLNEFERTFNGEDWGSNGPGVITRVLQSVCHTNVVDSMDLKHCRGFQVYPPSSFYAIPWPRWRWFFDPKETLKTLEMTKNSPVIHVWNKHSIKEKIRVGSKVAYGIVAQHNCPAVYSTCGEYF